MTIRPRRLTSALAIAACMVASRASSERPLVEQFRAAYARTPEVSGTLAGLRVDALSLEGLRLLEREDHTVEAGGISLIFGDTAPRVVIDVAVARDAKAARGFVDRKLRAVSSQLPAATDPSWGDYAFGDGGALVIGATQNIAWRVHAIAGFQARDAIAALRAQLVSGTPVYPTATLTVPANLTHAGAALAITTSATYTLHAEGGYITPAAVLKPFASGPVVVIATLTDELGRVAEVRARTTAR